jgi:acetylornithine deacetylase/succinyl-diaminopimelate desuccinylase-like protein
MATTLRPSAAIDGGAWDKSHASLVASLRSLIRIPSVNPPTPAGGELEAARWLAGSLEDAGVDAEVIEPVAGRGSVTARLFGDGTGGPPLLLLSHLDVVPAPPDRWTHDPFAADVADGYIYGRGAVDMKNLLAMELEVVRLLAAEARAAGRNPAADPIPDLRRDVIFTSTADEEAGGLAGAAWLASHRPETLRAAAAINEAGGVSVDAAGLRLYPIQVAEKGYSVYRLTIRGSQGHGSQPRPDNAVVLASEVVRVLAEPGPVRLTSTMRAFFDGLATALDARADGALPRASVTKAIRAFTAGEDPALDVALGGDCSPVYARAARAVVRDTISPNVFHAGVKYNVIPGEATIELDCRRLPGTDEPSLRRRIEDALGPELLARTSIELLIDAPGVEAPTTGELYPILASAITAADPDGIPLPVLVPYATDAKHLMALDVPAYGFSPLQQDDSYFDRWHGIDERVSIDGLRWGLPVLYDAIRRFCG